MNKAILLSAIITGLAGCSSDDPAVPTQEEITHLLLNGTWVSECSSSSSTSSKAQWTYNDGAGNIKSFIYPNLNCTAGGETIAADDDFTYTFGDEITLDGSVAGITKATQINRAFTSGTLLGVEQYDIFAVDNLITLYQGNPSGSADTRPTQLVDNPFTAQP